MQLKLLTNTDQITKQWYLQVNSFLMTCLEMEFLLLFKPRSHCTILYIMSEKFI